MFNESQCQMYSKQNWKEIKCIANYTYDIYLNIQLLRFAMFH